MKKNQSFRDHYAEWEMWAARTDWSDKDLYDRLLKSLHQDYIDTLAGHETQPKTRDDLVTRCKAIDVSRHWKRQSSGLEPVHSSTHSSDPNAMQIDATRMAVDQFFDGTNSGNFRNRWAKFTATHCRHCGDSHKPSECAHSTDKCKWCEKEGHWESVCMRRLQGKKKGPVQVNNSGKGKQRAAATDTQPSATIASTTATPSGITAVPDSSSPSSSSSATIAATPDANAAALAALAAQLGEFKEWARDMTIQINAVRNQQEKGF